MDASERFSFQRLWQAIPHALRLRGPLESNSTARMLHALVLAIAIWYGLWSLIILPIFRSPALPLRVAFAFLLETGPVLTLFLLRAGRLRQASLYYLACTWIYITIRIAFGGGINSTNAVQYVALPVLAAWLLGFEAALWTAGLSLGITLLFACLDIAGLSPPAVAPVTPLAVWAVMVQAILTAGVPVAQVLRALKDTLAQSRRSQEELQEYKVDLEGLVQRRTAELVEARDQALAANQAKSSFLANMSHELRTPLNAILGFSAIMRTDETLPERHRRDLAIVANSGEHLLALIDDVLDMAKIEAGGMTAESATVDLHTLVRDTVDMLRVRAQVKNLDLRLEISSETPRFIRTDAAKLRQVLTNLVANAVKYTEEGRVAVSLASRSAQDPRSFTLLFDVKDTGIGIASEDQVRIFDPFFQAGTVRKEAGTGLGLSISRHFVGLLGGTIHVYSVVGQGSRFHVEIPAERAELFALAAESPGLEEVAGLAQGQPDYRVLIVEDKKENWVLLRRLLQDAGFRVRVAENGASALQIFGNWRPRFIWMDLRLPGMGGLQAAKTIRRMEGGQDVTIVAVTASASAAQREEVLAAGLDDFIRKPYRPSEIFSCMARHLGIRYVYRAVKPPGSAETPATIRPEDIAVLPTKLRRELETAIISLDQTRIALVISRIPEEYSPLRYALSRLVDKTEYSSIFQALKG